MTEIKPIDGLPFWKKTKLLGIIKEKTVGDARKTSELIKEELEKNNPDKEKINQLTKKLEKGKEWQEEPLKEPILLLMRAGSADTEVFEDVPVGQFKIKRTDGKEGLILLDEAKIQKFKWGNKSVRGWIAFENNATPYPDEPKHDSYKIVRMMMDFLRNREQLMAKVWDARSNFVFTVGLVLAAILVAVIVIPPYLGIKLIGDDPPKNSVILNTDGLTTEQIAQIYQIKAGIEAKQAIDKNVKT